MGKINLTVMFILFLFTIGFSRQISCEKYFNRSSDDWVCFRNNYGDMGAFHKTFMQAAELQLKDGTNIFCMHKKITNLKSHPCTTEYECLSTDKYGMQDVQCRTSENIHSLYNLVSTHVDW